MAVWTAHRPLAGDVTWTAPSVGWGMHFAASVRDHERFDYFVESNTRDDAREVEVINNAQALVIAGRKCAASGSGAYGLDVYIRELGAEGAKEFAARWEMPWSDTDLSADAVIARLMGGAA